MEITDPDVHSPTKMYYAIRSFTATSKDAQNITHNDTAEATTTNTNYRYPLYPFTMDEETGSS